MQKFLDKAKTVIIAVSDWIKKNRGAVTMIATVVLGVIAAGAALLAFAAVIKVVAVGIGVVTTVISVLHTVLVVLGAVLGAIVSPVGLIVTAIAAMGAGLLYATGTIDQCTSALGQKFGELKDIALSSFQGIKDALAAGDFALAANILWLSVKVAFMTGIMPLKKIWIEFKSFLNDSWTVAVYSILKVWSNVCNGLEASWLWVTGTIEEAWSVVWGNVKKTFNSTIGFLMKKWLQLKGFFDSSIDVDAEISRIDAETEAKNDQIDKDTGDVVNRNKEREAEQSKRWDAENKSIDQAQDAEMVENMQKYNKEMDQAQKDLEKARGEWKSALDEAREKRENKEKEDAAAKAAGNAGSTLSGMSDKATKAVSGSFYADALARVSGGAGGSAEERTAKGVETLVQHTRKTNDLLKKQTGKISYK